jgi:DNA-binding transcriptional MerR regulator
MGRAERTERALEVATAVRLAARGVPDDLAARRLRRAERLIRREIGPSVPKRRAAALLGISVPALQRWISSGRLPVVRRPGGREEVEARALLDLLEEVRRLREDEGVSHAVVGRAFRRLAERGLPRRNLRPNVSARELRQSYLSSTPVERLRETAELSYVATTLARYGAERRRRDDGA